MHPYAAQPDGQWRLQVQLRERLRWGRRTASGARHLGQLEWILENKRIGAGVTVSYEGMTVYAYGSTAAGLLAADRAIRKALIADGRTAHISASRWDEPSGSWQEFDPMLPPGYEPATLPPAAPHKIIARTAECSAGRLVSRYYLSELEGLERRYELDCRIVSRTGLLRTRLEITLTGPEDQVLDALAYIRNLGKGSRKVDPGLVPYGGL